MLRYKLTAKPSKIAGTGAFAGEGIPARTKLGNMEGQIISLRKARQLAKQSTSIAIVEFGDGTALDATISNELRYINHSCQPNTYMRCAYHKVEFYTLRPIRKGEELTCNYGPTHHDGKLPCRCGAPNCKGFL